MLSQYVVLRAGCKDAVGILLEFYILGTFAYNMGDEEHLAQSLLREQSAEASAGL